ncbi:hypothetical protein D3C72_2544840 [compost metagenome]
MEAVEDQLDLARAGHVGAAEVDDVGIRGGAEPRPGEQPGGGGPEEGTWHGMRLSYESGRGSFLL